MPAASAVVGDIIDIAKSIIANTDHSLLPLPTLDNTMFSLKSMDECETRYYLRFEALDKPGGLGKVASILGQHNISISSVIQKERHEGIGVPIIMMTHEAIEKNVKAAIKEIDALPAITAKTAFIRVETVGGEEENLAIV
jgi:homoserine dehydrogenase